MQDTNDTKILFSWEDIETVVYRVADHRRTGDTTSQALSRIKPLFVQRARHRLRAQKRRGRVDDG